MILNQKGPFQGETSWKSRIFLNENKSPLRCYNIPASNSSSNSNSNNSDSKLLETNRKPRVHRPEGGTNVS